MIYVALPHRILCLFSILLESRKSHSCRSKFMCRQYRVSRCVSLGFIFRSYRVIDKWSNCFLRNRKKTLFLKKQDKTQLSVSKLKLMIYHVIWMIWWDCAPWYVQAETGAVCWWVREPPESFMWMSVWVRWRECVLKHIGQYLFNRNQIV